MILKLYCDLWYVFWLFVWIWAGFAALNFLPPVPQRKSWLNLLLLFAGPLALAVYGGYLLNAKVTVFLKSRAMNAVNFLNCDHDPVDITPDSKDYPIYAAVTGLIMPLLKRGSREFQIEYKNGNGSKIKVRAANQFELFRSYPDAQAQAVNELVKRISGMDVKEKRRPQEGVFFLKLKENTFSFKVASIGVMNGEKITVEIVPMNEKAMESIVTSEAPAEIVSQLCGTVASGGLLLLVSPEENGKTTTLYQVLRSFADGRRSIISIEKHPKCEIPDITQMETASGEGMTMPELLAACVSQHPDLIALDRIDDAKTAALAVQLAVKGTPVIATVAANSTGEALDKMLRFQVPGPDLAAALRAVCMQKLLPVLCTCKKNGILPIRLLPLFDQLGYDGNLVFEPGNCPLCRHTGFCGERGVFEIYCANDALTALLQQPTPEKLQQFFGSELSVLSQQILQLAAAGITGITAADKSLDI